mgnify:CR=1 FL=1
MDTEATKPVPDREVLGNKGPDGSRQQPTQDRLSTRFSRLAIDIREVNQYADDTFEYAENVIRELTNIGRIRREGEVIKPEDVSMGLAELCGRLSVSDQHIESNWTEIPDINKANESHYREVRDMFMESCRKIFPDVSVDIQYADLKGLAWRLEKNVAINLSSSVPSLQEQMKLLKDNPKKLAEIVDGLLYSAGGAMRDEAFNYSQSTNKDWVDMHNRLSEAAKDVFALQQMKDQLQTIVYDRRAADVTPSEARQIDTLRDQLEDKHAQPVTLEERKAQLDALWESSQRNQAAKREAQQKMPLEESLDLDPKALDNKDVSLKSGAAQILYDSQYTTLEQVKGIVTEQVNETNVEDNG